MVTILKKAGLAGLLHDYAKELPDQEFLELIDKYELDPELEKNGGTMSGMHGWDLQNPRRFGFD